MSSPATLEVPTKIRHQAYGKLACGPAPINNYVQVLGLTTGKTAGLPAVASMQNSTSVQGDWTPCYTPLTAPTPMVDLVVATGFDYTHAVGLGSDSHIYVAGSQNPAGKWEPKSGSGLISNPTLFVAGSLSAQLINTPTVFALSYAKTPWVAAYRSLGVVGWNSGYALPMPKPFTLQWLGARPDVGDAGATHAIGLTTDGKACEVAIASGPGTGSSNWTVGKGTLGLATGLPAFTQLLLVSGDAQGNFHVIGLGADGSVWDIDQYSPARTNPETSPKWSGISTRIAAAGSVTAGKIDFYFSGAINVVTWSGSGLKVLATYTTGWVPSTVAIPTSGGSLDWQVVNNMAGGAACFILGLGVAGLAYELAYYGNGKWSTGSKDPISQ